MVVFFTPIGTVPTQLQNCTRKPALQTISEKPNTPPAAALQQQATSGRRRIEEELTNLLLRNARAGGLAVVLGGALMAPVLATPKLSSLYFIWLGYMTLTAIVRMLVVRHFQPGPEAVKHWRLALRYYATLTILTGLGWAALPVTFLPELGGTGQVFMLIILVGTTSAAIPLLATHRWLYFAYAMPPLAASALIIYARSGSIVDLSLCGVILIYFGLLWSSMTKMHNALHEAMTFRFENLDLIESLQAEKAAIVQLNAQLQDENAARRKTQRNLEWSRAGLEAEVVVRTKDLEQARDAAEAASRAKSDFLATMSHEIRTPMNGIIGTTELLLRDSLSTGQRNYVETCRNSAANLLSLINDLLDFSKIEAGHLEIELQSVHLEKLCTELTKPFLPEVARKGLQLSVQIDEQLPEWINADRERLRQVLINLLGNALKFTEAGAITLQITREVENQARFQVQDTGCGLPLEKQTIIFDPFVQADSSTTRAYEGTGLGLAISSRLVKFMGGELGVVSEPNHGALFSFNLPLQEVQAPPNTEDNPTLANSDQLNLHVLVAEDNPVNQLICEAMLLQLGCTCDMANQGEEAVSLWRAGNYDAILMDLSMPFVDGYEATTRIRTQERSCSNNDAIPIIALTAHASERDRNTCLTIGMNGFATKPLTIDELQAVLEQAL